MNSLVDELALAIVIAPSVAAAAEGRASAAAVGMADDLLVGWAVRLCRVCTHACTHAHTHARTHSRMHARTHARTHARMHSRMHACTGDGVACAREGAVAGSAAREVGPASQLAADGRPTPLPPAIICCALPCTLRCALTHRGLWSMPYALEPMAPDRGEMITQ